MSVRVSANSGRPSAFSRLSAKSTSMKSKPPSGRQMCRCESCSASLPSGKKAKRPPLLPQSTVTDCQTAHWAPSIVSQPTVSDSQRVPTQDSQTTVSDSQTPFSQPTVSDSQTVRRVPTQDSRTAVSDSQTVQRVPTTDSQPAASDTQTVSRVPTADTHVSGCQNIHRVPAVDSQFTVSDSQSFRKVPTLNSIYTISDGHVIRRVPTLDAEPPISDNQTIQRAPTVESLLTVTNNQSSPKSPSIGSNRRLPALARQLTRSGSQISLRSFGGSKTRLSTLGRRPSRSDSLLSLKSNLSKPWTSSVVFMAMEIRIIADMAELFSKSETYPSPKSQNHRASDPGTLCREDDRSSPVTDVRDNDDNDDYQDDIVGLQISSTSTTTSTPAPAPPLNPQFEVTMDNHDDPQNPPPGLATPPFSESPPTWASPRSALAHNDAFRSAPAALSGQDEVRFGGTKDEANGRAAEVGIVLPLVPCPQGDGPPGGGWGQGDKPGSQLAACPDEKTPLQEPEADDRENWGSKMEFLLSVIGYAVDLANVWRFPFLCFKNGGGAFLLPYFSVLLLGAMPVFFMEMSMGQYHRLGPLSIWKKIGPMFKGIGMASCFMAYIVAFYYNVIIGWSFFYLFSSFSSSPLPWTTCHNVWNTGRCWPSGLHHNTSTNFTYDKNTSVTSTLEFFERGVLRVHRSPGLEDLGYVRWQLVLCTLLTFCMLYFCLWKGVKTTGKVVYVTAIMPYVILTILLIRGVTLPGAWRGIKFFITPDLAKLAEPGVWIDAAVQIFFSVGAGFGTHIAYASYNKFNNDCQRDVMVTVIVNSFTSIFSGFVIFSFLGYMSEQSDKPVPEVATEGPGLVFNVYPEAIATLPGSTGWAIIFFFMLLTLGIDSAFGGLESPLTGLRDELKGVFKIRYLREILTLVVVASAFLCSLPCLTEGGIYVFTILDKFAAGTSILFTVLCQVIAMSWFYGIQQFCRDIEKMTGSQPSMYWRICWKFVCPTLLLIIVISSIVNYVPLSYTTADSTYIYPFYANVLGWIIALSSMLLIPGYAVYKLIVTPGTLKERVALCISPECEHDAIRQKKYVKRFHKEHWLSM